MSNSGLRVGFFSVRNQLIIGIMLAVLLPLIVASVTQVIREQNRVEHDVIEQLELLSVSQANGIRETLEAQLDLLTSLSRVNSIEAFARVATNTRVGGDEVILAELQRTDEQWRADPNESNPVIQQVLAGPNSRDLYEFVVNSPSHTEVIVTDAYGALLAATSLTSDYYQADEDWWKAAWNNGDGAVYVANHFEYDESIDANVLVIAVPIVSGDRVVGVLRSNYEVAVIETLLSNTRFDKTGRALIVNSDGQIIAAPEDEQAAGQMLSGFSAAVLGATSDELHHINDYAGVASIFRATPIMTNGRWAALDALNWYSVLIQAESETLAPVRDAVRTAAAIAGVVLVFSMVAAFIVARQITRPLQSLTLVAQEFGVRRNLQARAKVRGNNEFGVLGHTFNTMAEEIQGILNSLEERIRARTNDLETSAEIAAAANQVRDVDDLLSLAVNLIRDRFDLYYVQVYLTDATGKWAVLKDGTGYVGRKLLGQGHKLPLDGKSLVATAIRTGEPVVVQDTANSHNFLPNPLLPETKSEMSVPLRAKSGVIGVLDIQHHVVDAFDDASRRLFQSMADQLAVTFENVNLFESATRRAAEMETVARVSAEITSNLEVGQLLQNVSDLTKDNFSLYHAHIYLLDEAGENLKLAAGAGEIGRVMVKEGRSIPLDHPHSIVAKAASERQGVIVNDVRSEVDFLPNPYLPNTQSELAVPLIVGETLIGVLDVQADATGHFGDEDRQVFSTLAAQIAVAVQNARTFAEREEAAERQGLAYELGQALTMQLDSEALLREAVKHVAETFEYYHVHIYILDEAGENLVVAEGLGQAGEEMKLRRHRIALDAEQSLVAQAAREQIPVVVQDVTANSDHLPDPLLYQTRSEVAVPLVIAGQTLGVLDVQHSIPNHFDAEEVQTLSTIASQLAIALSNAKQLEAVRISEEQNRILIETAPEAIFVADVATGKFISVNTNAIQMFGMSEAELLQVGPADVSPEFQPDKRRSTQAAMTYITQALNGETPVFEWVHRNAQGEDILCEVRLVRLPSPDRQLVRASITDIRERKRQEQQLAEALDIAKLGHWEFDFTTGIFTFTDQFYALLRTTAAEQGGYHMPAEEYARKFVHPDDAPIVGLEIQKAVETTDPNYFGHIEHRIIYADGEPGYISVRFRIEKDDQGRTIRSYGANQDITERKRQEQQLAEALDIAKLGHWEFDVATGIYTFNDQFYSVFRTTAEAEGGYQMTVEQYASRFVPPEIGSIVAEEVGKVLQGTQTYNELDHPVIFGDGTRGHVLVKLRIERDENGKALKFYGANQDITERKRVEIERQTLLEISTGIANAQTPDDLLRAVQGYAAGQGAYSASLLYLDNDEHNIPQTTTLVAQWDNGTAMPTVPTGTTFKLSDFPFSKLWMASPDEPLAVADVMTDPRVDETTRQAFAMVGTHGVVFIPLYTQDRWVGQILFSWLEPHPFIETEHRIYRAISYQAASAVDAIRSAAEIRRRAVELETVAKVSAEASTNLNVDELLWSVSNLTRDSFNLYHAHIYLLDDAGENLVLAAGAGEAGRTMVAEGRSISLSREDSLVATAARTRQGVVANDVTQNPNFLPHPALPDTKSEMAIPMIVGDDVIGVLDVQANVTNRFTHADVRIQETLASQVAIAVQNARSYAAVERQAEIEREAAERLRDVDRLKSQFLANMSHELRTPLNSIIGYAEVLLDGVDGELSEDAVEDVDAIYNSGKHLLSIINEILDLAKIEAGEMRLDVKEVDLVEFTHEIIRNGQVLVKDKPVILEMVEEVEMPPVAADPIRLRQILWNLVSNAVKFTEQGTVRVHLNMTDEGMVSVSVKDSGIGIPQEKIGSIFQRFSQVDGSSTRRAGGTGLGLTITQQLVRMHGGEIYVESNAGVGSTFWFTLPVFVREQV